MAMRPVHGPAVILQLQPSNAASGLVTAIAAGTTNIIFTISSGCASPAAAFKTLTVNPNANAGIITGSSSICINATATYSSNGDAGGTWSSTNTSVATVNASTGLVIAISAGTSNIIYTVTGCNAVPAFLSVTVNPNATAGIISGTTPLCSNATATYSSNGNPGGTWSSSNTAIATVNASTGFVTAVSPGTANVIYTVSSGCNNPVNSFKALTVSQNANAGTITGPSTLCIGSAALFFSSGDGGGTWSSSNTLVATVNSSSGFVTALSAGNADIIYTVTAGCNGPVSNFKNVIVSPASPAVPGNISGLANVCAGSTGFIFSITSVPGATTYNWIVPGGWLITSGQGTASITVSSGNSGGILQ